MKDVKAEEHFQFERHGYFVADIKDSKPGQPIFNRTVGLKDSWK
jgi:glutaminyl-tRNA synthetase